MATYSHSEYSKKLEDNLNKFLRAKSEIKLAVYETLQRADERIFDDGKDGNGSIIGTYSGKELYVSKKSPQSRKQTIPAGKYSKAKLFKNGKPRKSQWFPNYTAYKQQQGIATLGNKVNLQITKNFRRAFLTRSFPITSKSAELLIDIGVRSSTNNPIGKLKGIMTDKFPQAFKFTKAERAFLNDELREIFINTMSK